MSILRIIEDCFPGILVMTIIGLFSLMLASMIQEDIRVKKERVEFAKYCESRELNFASVNGAWACLKYSQPANKEG